MMTIEFHPMKKGVGMNLKVKQGSETLGHIQKQVWRFAFYAQGQLFLAHEDLECLKKMIRKKYGCKARPAIAPITHLYTPLFRS